MDPFQNLLQRLKLPLLGISAILFVFVALVFAHHQRTIETLHHRAPEGQTLCAVPTDAPRLLENAYRDYFQCTAAHTDPWFEAYPDEVAHLEEIYQALQNGRAHDLRGSGAAARFVEHHPTRFQTHALSLTDDEVADNLPTQIGSPAEVPGEFQRFFVDRDQQRLFLTSQTEGLVSLSIAERYQFEFEGAMNRESGREFFIYNDQFAFLEEHNNRQTGRDLIVLDISNPRDPQEVYRLPSILAQAPLNQDYFPELTSMPSYPPSFEHYLQVKEGRASIAACGAPPQLTTKPGIRCRPDGSCYRWEPRQEPGELACVAEPPRQGGFTSIAPLSYQVTERAASIWSALPIVESLLLFFGTTLFLLFGLASLLFLFSPLLITKSKRLEAATLEEKWAVSALHRWRHLYIPLFLLFGAGCVLLIAIAFDEFAYYGSFLEAFSIILVGLIFPALSVALLLFLASPLFKLFPGLRPYLPSAIRSAPGKWSAIFSGILLGSLAILMVLPPFELHDDFFYYDKDHGISIPAFEEAQAEAASVSISSGTMSTGGGSTSRRRTETFSTSRQASPAPIPTGQAAPQRARLPQGGQGGAGSLSQMMVSGQTLYILSARQGQPRGYLSTFDISTPQRPTLQHVLHLDNGPEALQLHDNLLLIAGRDALITASIAYPQTPRLLGQFQQECPVNFDPVVIHGSFAYRTIIIEPGTSRARCRTSQLQTIDLSQPHQPRLVHTNNLERPRGLAILQGLLFVADESRGIHLFSLENLRRPQQLTTWPLPRVKDLVISDFDLYALTPNQIETFYIAPLYQENIKPADTAPNLPHATTVRQAR